MSWGCGGEKQGEIRNIILIYWWYFHWQNTYLNIYMILNPENRTVYSLWLISEEFKVGISGKYFYFINFIQWQNCPPGWN